MGTLAKVRPCIVGKHPEDHSRLDIADRDKQMMDGENVALRDMEETEQVLTPMEKIFVETLRRPDAISVKRDHCKIWEDGVKYSTPQPQPVAMRCSKVVL